MEQLEPPRLFGTDGVRGPFGRAPLDEPTIRKIVRAAVELMAPSATPKSFVIGGDPRESTPEICRWIAEEVHTLGATPLSCGTLPTPGLAFLATQTKSAGAFVVSASHNPYPDNGVKLLDGDGFKITQQLERDIERRVHTDVSDTSARHGRKEPHAETLDTSPYIDHLIASIGADLNGLRVILDTGNGAASPIAQRVFEGAGARCSVLFDQPNGRDINLDCGSTQPQHLARALRSTESDIGFAFDGDADRVILCDANGDVHDGDAILYVLAQRLSALGDLPKSQIVATQMSNLGLDLALEQRSIEVRRCDVGDRAVVEMMRQHGLRLGGEQSGHIVDLELATTGDGLLTALQIARHLAATGATLAELMDGFERLPQVLLNVPVERRVPFSEVAGLPSVRQEIEGELGHSGRLLLRYSGTESVARIMVEGPDDARIRAMAERLAQILSAG